MTALFRIQELFSGHISIDGIDIANIPLPILRSRIGMIPQDPVMFSASVRFNLDPFNQHADDEIWFELLLLSLFSNIKLINITYA
jgi:ABC-type multidrug transport system fused ATPase/permease subunit